MSDPAVAPRLSVIICTHNRFDDLENVLSALAAQTLPRDSFEILVVDNSTDFSAKAAFRASVVLPVNAHWLGSYPPGLSRARNLGVERARAPFVAFLDDDAVPEAVWGAEILAAFETYPGTDMVAGPIEPNWGDQGRPEWLPVRLEGFLAILDLGSADRELSDSEHGFGANLAFRRDTLLAAGGFDEALGRKGNSTLLSQEEIVVQEHIQGSGRSRRYAARARVRHRIQPERVNQDWFRSRIAWQAVSECLQKGGWPWFDWSMTEARRAAAQLGISDAMSTLLTARDSAEFEAQIDLIGNLLRLLLMVRKRDEFAQADIFAPSDGNAARRERTMYSDAYRPAAAVPLGVKWVFADFRPGHGYLYDLYGDLPGSAFFELPGRAWDGGLRQPLDYLSFSLPTNARGVFLITLDPFSLTLDGADLLREAVSRWRVPVMGIQHRLPETVEQRRALMAIAPLLRNVVCLSEEMATRLRAECRVMNALALPLHPSKFRHVVPGREEYARRAIGAAPTQTVFAMVGEARQGKGLDLLLDTLEHLGPAVRERMFVLLGGRARDVDAEQIAQRLAMRRVAARVDLRQSLAPDNYAVLSSAEMADMMAASDFGVLLYQGAQRQLASGALPDFVWQRKRIIAMRDSMVGAVVARHGLGLTLDD